MIEDTADRLNEVIADYICALDAGERPDRQALLKQHPEFAADLRQFFADRDGFQRRAGALQLEAPRRQFVPPTVRYFGDYELLDEIARGGMGVVYKARQTSLNRIVAVKMILSGHLAEADDVKRFQSEAEAAASLTHPGIVAVHEVGLHHGQHYFSMDYIEGPSLAELVRDQPLPSRRAAGYVRSIAEAVHYAHEQGVLHRDLKPSNILLDAGDQVHVTDFGLARRVEGDSKLTQTGQILGTPSYLAPEQAAGKRALIGPASDVYSLGVVLYELLTGRPPFQSDSPVETIRQVLDTEPVSPRMLNPAVLHDLETICLKCLQKEPYKRYPTAQHLADDLRRFLAGEPILARPLSRPARLWRWCRRKPVIAGLTAAFLLALLGGTVISSYFAIESSLNAGHFRREYHRAEGLLGEKDGLLYEKERLLQQKGRLLDEKTVLATDLQTALQEQRAATEIATEQTKLAEGLVEQRTRLSNDLAGALTKQQAETDRADRQRERAEWLLYLSQIARAHAEWNAGDVAAAWQALNGSRRDLRGWEYDYLYNLFTRNHRTFRGHQGVVYCVAFSPDGKRIVSGSSDMSLIIWDTETGQKLQVRGHGARITSVAFSPDGEQIVSGSFDRTAKVWSSTSGQQLLSLSGHTAEVSSVAFSPDGKRVATGSHDKSIKVWDLATGKEAFSLTRDHLGRVYSVAFSPNGEQIVSGGGSPDNLHTITIWNAATGEPIRTLDSDRIGGGVVSVAFSPDGQRIVSGGVDTRVKVWDAVSGRKQFDMEGHPERVSSVAFSANGKWIASGSDDTTLKVWDATTGHEILSLKGHTRQIYSVAFSPNGTRIVSGGWDTSVKVWNTTAQATLKGIESDAVVAGIALSPDGKHLAGVTFGGSLTVWDAKSRQEMFSIKGHVGHIRSVAFSPDGKRIVTAGEDRTLKIWDATSGNQIRVLEGHSDMVVCVVFSPDGKQIVSGSWDKTIKVWDAATGQERLSLEGHLDRVVSVAYSPGGDRIVSGSVDKTLKVWDAMTGDEILGWQPDEYGVLSVAFSPDGKRIVSGGVEGVLKIWNAATGEQMVALEGHTGLIHCVAYSPDGKRVVSGSSDNTVKLWDVETGQETLSLRGHIKRVTSVAFSLDGKRIVSGSSDQTIQVWDARSPTPTTASAEDNW